MFDRSNFDRNMFDKQSSVSGLSATIQGYSTVTTNLVINSNFNDFTIKGYSSVNASLVMRQTISSEIYGNSSVTIDDKFKMVYRMTPYITSFGDITPDMAIKTPLGEIKLGGSSILADVPLHIVQEFDGAITSGGNMETDLVLQMHIGADLSGSGDTSVENQFALLMPIDGAVTGNGDIESIRIGGLNSDTIAFTNLGLLAGQTLTIDTDDLDVYIDNLLNVSSVTNDSVFFQLQPGENELTFVSPNNPNLTVTIIYQNRWL